MTSMWENLSSGFAKNKGADQPTHKCRLISAFVITIFDSILSKLATGEILIFYLVSVAEETGLSLTIFETPKIGFVASAIWYKLCLILREPVLKKVWDLWPDRAKTACSATEIC